MEEGVEVGSEHLVVGKLTFLESLDQLQEVQLHQKELKGFRELFTQEVSNRGALNQAVSGKELGFGKLDRFDELIQLGGAIEVDKRRLDKENSLHAFNLSFQVLQHLLSFASHFLEQMFSHKVLCEGVFLLKEILEV